MAAGIAQDRLGVLVGLDESSASARMSRYESGVHEPSYSFVARIADHFGVPVAYFFCEDDELASVVIKFYRLTVCQREQVLKLLDT